jgi:N-acetylmuramoyl-L-alanine amidase
MRDIACARRVVLRLLAGCAAAASLLDAASAQPPGRAEPWLQPPPEKPQLPRYLPMIVLDPGHGGIDPGAIGPSGVYEKNIVYSTARYLAAQLIATRQFRVALTRGPDEFVPLRDRVARARAFNADLFLAIHADALPDSAMRGLSVFTLSALASDREAAALADSENRDVVDGMRLWRKPREVLDILLALARRQTDNLSIELARDVVTALRHEVVLLDNPQRSADFAVLTAPDIPSALVELGCLSNPAEEHLLQQPSYQQRLARGLAHAIEAYFTLHRPDEESAPAPPGQPRAAFRNGL